MPPVGTRVEGLTGSSIHSRGHHLSHLGGLDRAAATHPSAFWRSSVVLCAVRRALRSSSCPAPFSLRPFLLLFLLYVLQLLCVHTLRGSNAFCARAQTPRSNCARRSARFSSERSSATDHARTSTGNRSQGRRGRTRFHAARRHSLWAAAGSRRAFGSARKNRRPRLLRQSPNPWLNGSNGGVP